MNTVSPWLSPRAEPPLGCNRPRLARPSPARRSPRRLRSPRRTRDRSGWSWPRKKIPLQTQGGGFSLFDFRAGRTVLLHDGTVDRHADGSQTFRTQADDLSLEATFTPNADGSVRVRGLLKSNTGRDRAIVLRYGLPMKAEGAVFGCDTGATLRVGPDTRASVGNDLSPSRPWRREMPARPWPFLPTFPAVSA